MPLNFMHGFYLVPPNIHPSVFYAINPDTPGVEIHDHVLYCMQLYLQWIPAIDVDSRKSMFGLTTFGANVIDEAPRCLKWVPGQFRTAAPTDGRWPGDTFGGVADPATA